MDRGSHRILSGDVLAMLPLIEPGSVQTCITSPPYWGLRNYQVDGQLGSERTPDEYIQKQVEVFRLVRDCLHPTGTMFVNLGDTYASGKGTCFNPGGGAVAFQNRLKDNAAINLDRLNKSDLNSMGLKPGDLCNMPHRLASALQADGWLWRDTIIWRKPSPMPSSQTGWRWVRCKVKIGRQQVVQGGLASWDMGEHAHGPSGDYRGQEITVPAYSDCPGCLKCSTNGGYVLRKGSGRCTSSHEYIFMFAKSKSYYYDSDASAEPANGMGPGNKRHKGATAYLGGDEAFRVYRNLATIDARLTRTARNVWTISAEPLKEKHFAAYPTELVRRAMIAATPAIGCCPACRTPYSPVVESERVPTRPGLDNKVWKGTNGDTVGQRSEVSPNLDPQRHIAVVNITGYRPSCSCNAGQAIPCLILDPYLGSGTTAQTATWYGRDAVGVELNPEYVAIAERRIQTMPRCLEREMKAAGKIARMKTQDERRDDDGLFEGYDHNNIER